MSEPTASAEAPTPSSMSDEDRKRLVASTRRFDLRRILGALFLLFGLIVTLTGIVRGGADLKQTGGVDINLWTGVSMLVLGALFLLWDRLSPVPESDIIQSAEGEEDANTAAAQAEGSV